MILLDVIKTAASQLSDIKAEIEINSEPTIDDFFDDAPEESKARFEPSEFTVFKPKSLELLKQRAPETSASKFLPHASHFFYSISDLSFISPDLTSH